MNGVAILNPRAGLAAARARAALERSPHWRGMHVRLTTGPGDARRYAAEAAAAGAEIVLAIGGDGTANEIAWGLLGSSTALGLVPMGSGNGLARTLGIPLKPDSALAALAEAVPRAMDVGMINERPFLNVAGAGFDAQVGLDFHEHGRRGGRRGVFTYVRLSVLRTMNYRAESFVLDAGGQKFEGRAYIVAFVNGRQYGGGAVLVPGARLDDGLLDIVIIEDAPALELAWNAQRLFFGTLSKYRRYRHIAASTAVLTATTPVPHHRDGEPEQTPARLEASVLPRALRILVPRKTASDPHGPFQPQPLIR
ncbi:MAG TPA: YegS/Rv2252/BmrU family lipid kinase [Vicinamibacteria bacterium]|nr:YegS/Rv2252/BmrU family lipid kinase [Vicinamibacteria bacterium]